MTDFIVFKLENGDFVIDPFDKSYRGYIVCPYIPITHVRVMSGSWDKAADVAADCMANEILQEENKQIINSIIDSIGSGL